MSEKITEMALRTSLHEIYIDGEYDSDEVYKCYAPPTWDRKWEEWTDEDKAILEKHEPHGLNCEGGLIPGAYCGWCSLRHPQGYGKIAE